MFSIFRDGDPKALMKQARLAYEKVVATRTADPATTSARKRMALLCRAHLDKTFVQGAEQMALYQDAIAAAVARNTERPSIPKASLYQRIETGSRTVYTYLPPEYAEEAFLIGARYQRTELTAQQAILEMQTLADHLLRVELHQTDSLEVLRFLREELAAAEPGSPLELADPLDPLDPSPSPPPAGPAGG